MRGRVSWRDIGPALAGSGASVDVEALAALEGMADRLSLGH